MKHDETIWKNNDQQHATLRLDICCLNWYCMVFQEQNINRFQAVQGTLRHGCGTSLTSTIKLPFYLGTNLLDVLKNPMNKGGYSTYKNPMNKWGHSTYKNPMNKWGYSTYTYIYICVCSLACMMAFDPIRKISNTSKATLTSSWMNWFWGPNKRGF